MERTSPFKDLALPEFAERATAPSIWRSYGLNPLQTEEETKAIIRMMGLYAAIPLLALYGEDVDFTERAPFLHFVETTPAGHTLAIVAGFARRRRTLWTRFCYSIRQPGFVHAWTLFCHATRKHDNESISDQIKRLRLDVGHPLEGIDKKIAERLRDSLPVPGTREFEEFIADQARVTEAERKKQARKRPPKAPSLYKEIVERDFLTNALWCRSTSSIVSEYFPNANADEHEKHEREFNKAFSLLKLSKARRNDIPECPDIPG